MLSRGYTCNSPCRATLHPVSLHFFPRLATKSSRFKDPSYANEVLYKNAMCSSQETDSVVISVEGSDETPVATGFIAFESKLDSLTDSMVKIPCLAIGRLTQSRMVSLIAEEE